jgi:hypothetical protein
MIRLTGFTPIPVILMFRYLIGFDYQLYLLPCFRVYSSVLILSITVNRLKIWIPGKKQARAGAAKTAPHNLSLALLAPGHATLV